MTLVLTRLAENTRPKKSPKIRHLRTIAQLSRAVFSQLRHISTIDKNLLNSNISSTCSHNMVNFDPLMAEIVSGVWGIPANFNGFRVFASLLHRRRSTEVNQTLHDVWPSPALVYYTYIHFGGSCPYGILPDAKFTLRPSLALSYVDGVSARNLLNDIYQRVPPIFGGRPSLWASAHILARSYFYPHYLVHILKKSQNVI